MFVPVPEIKISKYGPENAPFSMYRVLKVENFFLFFTKTIV